MADDQCRRPTFDPDDERGHLISGSYGLACPASNKRTGSRPPNTDSTRLGSFKIDISGR